MNLKGLRAPLIAGLVLVAGLVWWVRAEVDSVEQRHHVELQRYVEGVLLALDASHDLLRPPATRPGTDTRPSRDRILGPLPFGPGPRGRELQQLEPILRRMVTVQPRILWIAIVENGAVVARTDEAPKQPTVEGPRGERLADGRLVSWRPLGAPPARVGDGGEGAGRSVRPGRAAAGNRSLPRAVPIAVIAMDSALPARAVRRDLMQIGEKIGLALIGVVALLTAWVMGSRSRSLAHRLEAERVRRSHLEELSLAASGLAHETKNPLGIIRGLAQRLEREPDLPSSQRAAAGQILEEADRAVSRLGEFMSYARVREPELASVEARRVLDKAVAVLAADLESTGVTARIEAVETHVVADEDMLLQVVLNLLLNSLEASSAGSNITLRLTLRAATATLAVEDEGRGIDPGLRSRIFKPYVSGRPEGHGLGLAIVKRVADQHGWSVAVRSRPGGGTTVQIDDIRTGRGSDDTR